MNKALSSFIVVLQICIILLCSSCSNNSVPIKLALCRGQGLYNTLLFDIDKDNNVNVKLCDTDPSISLRNISEIEEIYYQAKPHKLSGAEKKQIKEYLFIIKKSSCQDSRNPLVRDAAVTTIYHDNNEYKTDYIFGAHPNHYQGDSNSADEALNNLTSYLVNMFPKFLSEVQSQYDVIFRYE